MALLDPDFWIFDEAARREAEARAVNPALGSAYRRGDRTAFLAALELSSDTDNPNGCWLLQLEPDHPILNQLPFGTHGEIAAYEAALQHSLAK